MIHRAFSRILTASLLGGVSMLGLGTGAQASRVMFSTDPSLSGIELAADRDMLVENGITQVRLDNGAVAAFVDGAHFAIRSDGAIDLRSGTVTVVSPSGLPVVVMMPDGVRGSVAGKNASASFTADGKGAHGSVIDGQAIVVANGVTHNFPKASFWGAGHGQSAERLIANSPTAVTAPGDVQPMREGGISAAAQNGIPVALGVALAAVGAHGDILEAANRIEAYDRNPVLTAFPAGDYTLLTAYAAEAAAPYGGAAFNGAAADIVRTYFQYLAAGGHSGDFRAAYARSLVSYLDLVRSGALPSGFTGATQAQLAAYIGFIGRTEGFGALSATNRSLLDAYLAFLAGGGTPDGFGPRASSLVGAYLDFLRAGGDPAAFQQASASVIAQYLAILQSGGIKSQLTVANQALLDAFLKSLASNGNGLAFANSAATGLAAFTAFLNAGGYPSQYTGADAASVRAYLETLNATGLFDRVLGQQAAFLRAYLVFLQNGGSADGFDKLPINIASSQANALGSFYIFIQNGGIPSSYALLSQAQINAYLKGLKDSGLFDQLLGVNARFLSDYYAYLLQGGNPDLYAGLPNVDLNAYATQVASFVAYLKSGRLPSGYETLSLQQLRDYLNALSASGRLAELLGGDAGFLASYLAYLQGGGLPDQFSGLPINTYTAYSTQLTVFLAYLNAGGLPSGYTALTAAQIRSFLETLLANGQLAALLGANAGFFNSYLVYLQGGGGSDGFAGLPIVTYTGYSTQLAAFIAYLNAGGLPSGYANLTAAQIRTYLEALQANGQFAALLGANAGFFTTYLAYLQGGGSADGFSGLPIVTYRDYATALNAFYVYIAAGGHPSGYFALTAAQILAYLNALGAAGQSTALLGNQASFFAGYLTYLAGGGNGDQYAGLPGVMPPAPNYTYAGGFPATGGKAYIVTTATGVFTNTAEVDANGVLQSAAANATRGTAATVDVAGDKSVVIGRWVNGVLGYQNNYKASANGVPYVVLAPIVGNLPVSGTVDYSILAATRPVYASGRFTPGTFSGALTIGFGSTVMYGIDGKIVIPETNGDVTYAFASANRMAGVANAITNQGPFLSAALTGTGVACGAGKNCRIAFNGGFAGASPATRLGLAYQTIDDSRTNPEQINGTVIFAANATPAPTGTGGMIAPTPPPVYRGGFPAATGRVLTAANNGQDFSNALRVSVDPKTGILGQVVESIDYFGIGTTTAVDVAGDASVVIGRYTNGTTYGNYGGFVVGATGIPYAVLAPKTGALPTSGTITYSTLAATQPVELANAGTPGTFLGQLSITFGAMPTYFINGSLTMPEPGGTKAYNFASANNTSFNLSFPRFSAALSSTGAACASTSCKIGFFGDFAGSTPANRLGLIYLTSDPATPTAAVIKGAVIFGADGTFTPGAVPTPVAGGAPTGTGLRFGRNGNFSMAVDIVATPDGKLSSYDNAQRGTTTDHENGGLAGVIGWTRWSGGKTEAAGDGTTVVPVNGGYGRVWGTPATAVPTAGIATYDLAGSTAVTAQNGTAVPGTIRSASLAVDFGQRKVGFESDFTVGGIEYAIASNGGIAVPAMILGVNNEFYGTQPSQGVIVKVTGNGCNPGTCPADASGFLAGPGASHAGVSFGFYNPDVAGFAGAALAFGKHK